MSRSMAHGRKKLPATPLEHAASLRAGREALSEQAISNKGELTKRARKVRVKMPSFSWQEGERA